MENTKMMKTASTVDRILKILQGFAVAGAIVCAIFIPLTAILGEKVIANASSLDLGYLGVKLTGDQAAYLNIPNIKASIIIMLIAAIIALAVIWYCLRILRRILDPMKEGRPFAQGISMKIKQLGWAVLIGGGIIEIARVIGSIFELKAYQIENLLNPDTVSVTSFDYSINLWFVATALILFFLSYVFRYGEELQQEADETL